MTLENNVGTNLSSSEERQNVVKSPMRHTATHSTAQGLLGSPGAMSTSVAPPHGLVGLTLGCILHHVSSRTRGDGSTSQNPPGKLLSVSGFPGPFYGRYHIPVCVRTFLMLFLVPALPWGGPGGGSVLPLCSGNRGFGAGSGPDLGG